MIGIPIGLGAVLLLLIFLAASSLRVLREYERAVVFQLGRFWRVKGPGLVILIPAIQQMVRIDLRIIVVDVHAEATSEKVALGRYLDGKVGAVYGTHTHVQTADEQILPGGTAYISDLGMTGPTEGIIGMESEAVLDRFITGFSDRFSVEKAGTKQFCAAVVTIDVDSGRATEIKRIFQRGIA